ncbi:hypothetical protein AEA09_08090 [Lysinibacillus contaminans]|uniref:Uncharacterized protein n=1 Tax=Lysinibacillus contaminans TaxID=1293441 RepID=A0ABR5K162_9BACI|nr:hypothetical protein [Lysinibacillus contaminans]KOS68513.1 hypothetical protein AEA09_08090 [Lysinibacillus contaminans]
MKIDIRNDVMDKLKAMGIDATEQTINSIVQRVYEAVITRDYYDIIEEAIKVENERRDAKKDEDPQTKLSNKYEGVKEEVLEPTNNRTSFEDPVKKDIQKNLLGGLFWWL